LVELRLEVGQRVEALLHKGRVLGAGLAEHPVGPLVVGVHRHGEPADRGAPQLVAVGRRVHAGHEGVQRLEGLVLVDAAGVHVAGLVGGREEGRVEVLEVLAEAVGGEQAGGRDLAEPAEPGPVGGVERVRGVEG